MIRADRHGHVVIVSRLADGRAVSSMHLLSEEAADLRVQLEAILSAAEAPRPGPRPSTTREDILALPDAALEVLEAAAAYARHDPGLGWPRESPQAQARARFHRSIDLFRAARRALNRKEPLCAETSNT